MALWRELDELDVVDAAPRASAQLAAADADGTAVHEPLCVLCGARLYALSVRDANEHLRRHAAESHALARSLRGGATQRRRARRRHRDGSDGDAIDEHASGGGGDDDDDDGDASGDASTSGTVAAAAAAAAAAATSATASAADEMAMPLAVTAHSIAVSLGCEFRGAPGDGDREVACTLCEWRRPATRCTIGDVRVHRLAEHVLVGGRAYIAAACDLLLPEKRSHAAECSLVQRTVVRGDARDAPAAVPGVWTRYEEIVLRVLHAEHGEGAYRVARTLLHRAGVQCRAMLQALGLQHACALQLTADTSTHTSGAARASKRRAVPPGAARVRMRDLHTVPADVREQLAAQPADAGQAAAADSGTPAAPLLPTVAVLDAIDRVAAHLVEQDAVQVGCLSRGALFALGAVAVHLARALDAHAPSWELGGRALEERLALFARTAPEAGVRDRLTWMALADGMQPLGRSVPAARAGDTRAALLAERVLAIAETVAGAAAMTYAQRALHRPKRPRPRAHDDAGGGGGVGAGSGSGSGGDSDDADEHSSVLGGARRVGPMGPLVSESDVEDDLERRLPSSSPAAPARVGGAAARDAGDEPLPASLVPRQP